MKTEEMVEKVEEASKGILMRMDWESSVLREKLLYLLAKLSESSLAVRYRDTLSSAKELLWRTLLALRTSVDNNEYLRLWKELLKSHVKVLARRLAGVSPYFHKVAKNKMALIYFGICIGYIGGRILSKQGLPHLKPLSMMSVVCGSYSGPDGLAFCKIDMPRIQTSREILVKVMAAGLDLTDVRAVSGWGRLERGKLNGGFTIGRDFCGVVMEAGVDVDGLSPGDRVWGALPYSQGGTLSEHLVLEARQATTMPSNLNWEGAATVPYSALQVWSALVWRGGLKPDNAGGVSVLVVDGVTDTGCLALQLAAKWGASVTALCPNIGRTVPLAHALGAHIVVAARECEEDSVCELREAREGRNFDLIVLAGDLVSEASVRCLLSAGGRLTSTLPPSLSSDSWGLLRRAFHPLWRCLVNPPRVPSRKKLVEPLNYMTREVESGSIQTVLGQVIAPQEVAAALTRIATQDTVGKTVVVFDRL